MIFYINQKFKMYNVLMLVFADDSGDPGFKIEKGSSKLFSIALIMFQDFLEAEKTSLAIKELRRELRVNDRFEFKFNKLNHRFKIAFINKIKKFKFTIRAIVVDKPIIYSATLRENKDSFYNYIVKQVFSKSRTVIKNAKIKFDKRGERTLRNEMRVYLSRELDNKRNKMFTDFIFVDSKKDSLIQLADIVVGAICCSYNGKNKEYLNKLKKQGRVDDIWLFK